MKILIALLLIYLITPKSSAQEDEAYTITNYYSKYRKEVPGKILFTKIIGIADTTVAFVECEIVDYENKEIPFSYITVINLLSGDSVMFKTDSLGKQNSHMNPGTYLLALHNYRYGRIIIDSLVLLSGQIMQIKVSLGSGYTIEEWQTIQAKPLILKPKKRKRN